MVFSNFKKMSKWGVAASVAVALLGAGSAAYAGFAVGSIGSAKGLKATPSTDVFGNSLDNLILGQLSTEDLDSAGIDYSACGSSPLPAYVLDYLETILSQDAEDTSEWQSDIDAISNCDFDAAVWQVGEANDNNSAATVVTASVLDEIVGEDGYVNAMLAANSSTDISDVQALFPSALASVTASSVKIMIRPETKGPRSLIRTTNERPFSRFITRTADGIGKVLWAAETISGSKISPFAVSRPANSSPYQDAMPVSS